MDMIAIMHGQTLVGQKLGLVYNSKCMCVCIPSSTRTTTKQSNLKLKTWLKQLLGHLLLAFVLLALRLLIKSFYLT
jgi:hypothetical protein